MNKFWTDDKEQEFLMSYIKPEYSMLEYGSGNSTIYLKDHVKSLTSVEHNPEWYGKLSPFLTDIEYIYTPPNNPNWEAQFDSQGRKNVKGDDGSFEDFANYVKGPFNSDNFPFDIIFIDGRARVACAFLAVLMLNHKNPNSRIFIHDFGPDAPHPFLPYRTHYDTVLNWLEIDSHCKTMYCFKPMRK